MSYELYVYSVLYTLRIWCLIHALRAALGIRDLRAFAARPIVARCLGARTPESLLAEHGSSDGCVQLPQLPLWTTQRDQRREKGVGDNMFVTGERVMFRYSVEN